MIVGDVDLHVEERGSGPALLLIPGIPAVASDWAPLAERLAAGGRRVIAYDNRGSGSSTVTPAPYSVAQLAADAAGLIEALDAAPADVFGMSLGGMIAQELALARPDLVRGLILGCTHAGIRHAARQPPDTVAAFSLQTDDWGERMRALAPLAFAPGADPEMIAAFIAKKSDDVQDPEGYGGQIAAALAHDSYDRLPQITAPTLVLTGDRDQVIPHLSSDVLAQRIPDARLHIVTGTGHLFFLEEPDATVRAIEAFLDSGTKS